MNNALLFRSQMQSEVALGQAVIKNFESFIGTTNAWSQEEHNEDGTHGVVTATSLLTAFLQTTGKIKLGRVTYVAPTIIPTGRIDNLMTPGLATASILKIRNTAAGITLTGIDATGRTPGELLLVINDDLVVATPQDLAVAALDANSSAGNQFIGSAASRAPWNLQGSEMMLLVYDTYETTGTQTDNYGWRVLIA